MADLCDLKPFFIDPHDGQWDGYKTVVIHYNCHHCDRVLIIPDGMMPDDRNCPRHKPQPKKAKWNVPTKKDYPAKRQRKRGTANVHPAQT